MSTPFFKSEITSSCSQTRLYLVSLSTEESCCVNFLIDSRASDGLRGGFCVDYVYAVWEMMVELMVERLGCSFCEGFLSIEFRLINDIFERFILL